MVIDGLKQHPIVSALNNMPTADEICSAIKKMKNNKAPMGYPESCQTC